MHPCSHCGRSFATAAKLKGHMAAVRAAATKRGQPRPNHRTTTAPPPPRSWPGSSSSTPPPRPAPLHCSTCGTIYPANQVHRCQPSAPPPPAAPAPSRPTWVGTPKPTVENARLEVLVSLENLYALSVKAIEARGGDSKPLKDKFETYQKMLRTALGSTSNAAMENEAKTALCVAGIQLWKATF